MHIQKLIFFLNSSFSINLEYLRLASYQVIVLYILIIIYFIQCQEFITKTTMNYEALENVNAQKIYLNA